MLLGEEGQNQGIIEVTNVRSSYVRTCTFDFQHSLVECDELDCDFPVGNSVDAGNFIVHLMVDLIESQTIENYPTQVMSTSSIGQDYPAPPKVGNWWGGKQGFIVRAQNKPGTEHKDKESII